MSDATLLLQVEARKKSGWLAAFLNLFFPGVGYAYCGNWILGVLVFIVAVPLIVVTVGVAGAVIYPVVFIDGFLAAGRHNKKLILKVLAEDSAKGKVPNPA